MDVALFKNALGHLELADGFTTFAPSDLPAAVDVNSQLAALLSQADRNLGELCGAANHLPNPRLLATAFASKEALSSSRIEGTRATLAEVLKAEASPEERRTRATIEVTNAKQALFHGTDNSNAELIPLLKAMHTKLFEAIPTSGKTGEFRKIQNFLSATSRVEDAWFVPPAPARIPELMTRLAEYVDADNSTPVLLKAALVHYQFETIHPFLDGNGRIGRALIPVFLLRKQYVKHPLVFLSEYFEKYRPTYQERLLHANQTGDFQKWFEFFLIAVAEQSRATLARINSIMQIRKDYLELVKHERAPRAAVLALDELLASPYISTPRLAVALNVTYPTAERAITYLTNKDMLVEVTGYRRNRIFAAAKILDAIEPGWNEGAR